MVSMVNQMDLLEVLGDINKGGLMMIFQTFCNRTASKERIDVSSINPVPDRYKKAVDSIINIMKDKTEIFNVIEVPFVEVAFNDQDFEQILEDKLTDGEIPDEIICKLSAGIYNKAITQLTDSEQAIIKVLSTYICIQN